MRRGGLKLVWVPLLFLGVGSAQAQLDKGTMIFDPYYGFPNFGKTIAIFTKNALKPIIEREIPDVAEEVEIGITGFGPLGGRFEYMVHPRIGLGLDFIYNSTTANFAVDSLSEDGTLFDKFDVNYKMTRLRFHFRANFHYLNKKHIDMYVGLGAGYNNRIHRIQTNFIDFLDISKSFSFAYPWSGRFTLWGMRVYPHPNVGINMEIGFGGPLLSAGLSVRLRTKKENSTSFESP
ncbi:hypothetical protein JYT74_01755 [Crocinitomix catalasitica]|nr:hypothetical protein [Crocinitomix catalasitica]